MEIELRAYLKSFDDTIKHLENLGAQLVGQERIIDYWLCPNQFASFDQIAQDAPGSYGLRIREKKKGNVTYYVELNCKVLEKANDHNVFHEYCTEVESVRSARKIFEAIGFKIFCTIDKMRTIYKIKNCEINLENIKNFPPTIELEIIDKDNIEEHKRFLNDLMLGLGINQNEIIGKSITYEFMKKYAFNQP